MLNGAGRRGEGVGEMVVKYPDEKPESGEAAMSVREHLQEIYRRLEFLESAFPKEEQNVNIPAQ